MRGFERIVYDFVKRDPRLKRVVRDVYQRLCDFVPVRRSQFPASMVVREGFFFGFHDKCPWSADGRYLLAHRFTIPLRMPRGDDSVGIGFFSGDNWQQFTTIGTSKAWNWHQGSMLQWLGSTDSLVYNDYGEGHHVARILDVTGKIQGTLPLPVSAVSPDGSKAASYDFARLRVSPYAYSYANGEDDEEGKLVPTAHGLSLLDVSSGTSRLLLSVADVASMEPEASMQGAFHYFTHCQFSPSGRRLKFFHRWLEKGYLRWTRLVGCDLLTGKIWLSPTSGMVSHVAWRDDDHLLAYAYAQPRASAAGYYLFKFGSDKIERVGEHAFTSDGHPSYSADRRWILTDTYPDRFRASHLVLYDTCSKVAYDVAKFHSPRRYAGRTEKDIIRCDLHPRWNRDSTFVCVDSVHTGIRALCTVPVWDLVCNNQELAKEWRR